MELPTKNAQVLIDSIMDIEEIVLPQNWFAIAFNRLLHSDFAPEFMWKILEKCHKEHFCLIGLEESIRSHEINLDRIPFSSQSIIDYLGHDFRHTNNHIVTSLNGDLIIRLDQDVIYFFFHAQLKDHVLELLGGREEIESMILNEFDGIKGRNGNVEKYVTSLLENA